LGEGYGGWGVLETESGVVGADVCLAIFDMGEAWVGDGVGITEAVLIRELIDDFVKVPALTKHSGGLFGDVAELAWLWRVSV
jgi:hypothetical protein